MGRIEVLARRRRVVQRRDELQRGAGIGEADRQLTAVICTSSSGVSPVKTHGVIRHMLLYVVEYGEGEAMATVTDIGTLIVQSPEIRGGRPRIAGTGVTVRRIVGWYKLGLSPEEIARRVGHLSLAQVHAALAYYHANREAIEADIAAEEAEYERLEQEHLLQQRNNA